MVFEEKNYVKVTAAITGSTSRITTDGITAQAFTPEEAKTQLDKFLNIVGKSVNTTGMVRTRSEEAVENG